MMKALFTIWICVGSIFVTKVLADFKSDTSEFIKESKNRMHLTTSETTVSYECDKAKKMMTVEARIVKSSDIRLSECSSIDVALIRVFAIDTFSVDSDLYLNKTNEVTLQISAYKWDVTKQATFYLNGIVGKPHPPLESKGTDGKQGNKGTNAGNFVGIANEVVNSDSLSIQLNGGSGGTGQDGTGSDDTYVVFDEKVDSKGMTLSFKSGNNYINAHYQKYFKEKGYDAALKETGEHHTKIGFPTIYTVSKVFTLYSQNCCGPTGAGGDGGIGGSHGEFTFLPSNENTVRPKSSAINGPKGEKGKYGRKCTSFDLEVDIDTKLTIFIGYALQSNFINTRQVQNSKCTNSAK